MRIELKPAANGHPEFLEICWTKEEKPHGVHQVKNGVNVYTLSEVTKLLGVSRARVTQLRQQGSLDGWMIAGRWYYRAGAVLDRAMRKARGEL